MGFSHCDEIQVSRIPAPAFHIWASACVCVSENGKHVQFCSNKKMSCVELNNIINSHIQFRWFRNYLFTASCSVHTHCTALCTYGIAVVVITDASPSSSLLSSPSSSSTTSCPKQNWSFFMNSTKKILVDVSGLFYSFSRSPSAFASSPLFKRKLFNRLHCGINRALVLLQSLFTFW